ncbi:MAG: histidinol dehydrogenase [Candidatus Melainabacteria bacterium]|nr:histidinol dehydrogenase [Candidatus Melainabacteria bacterium]
MTNTIPLLTQEASQQWVSTFSNIRSLWQAGVENLPCREKVQQIIQAVVDGGDLALKQLAKDYGDPVSERIPLSEDEVQLAIDRVLPETKNLISLAANNIRHYAETIVRSVSDPVALSYEGFSTGMRMQPVERVGCYVPGGRYPLPSTALMTALSAQASGVPFISMASPHLQDEMVYAGSLAGVNAFYRMGGAQAIAALAFGTESVLPVDLIVGPGNAYVTEAKRQLQGLVGIDMLAGPSELVLIADEQANAEWLALDLLAQAEHDPDARVYLLTDSLALAEKVQEEIPKWLMQLALPAFLHESLLHSALVVLPTLQDCMQVANRIAPEHLQLSVQEPRRWLTQLQAFGALFLGYQATVPYGDYWAGPNHTLPTQRNARFVGPLSPLTFLRPQSWVEVSDASKMLAENTACFAELEGLTAHAAAARIRKQHLEIKRQ